MVKEEEKKAIKPATHYMCVLAQVTTHIKRYVLNKRGTHFELMCAIVCVCMCTIQAREYFEQKRKRERFTMMSAVRVLAVQCLVH